MWLNIVEYYYPYIEKGVGIFIMIIVCDRLKTLFSHDYLYVS